MSCGRTFSMEEANKIVELAKKYDVDCHIGRECCFVLDDVFVKANLGLEYIVLNDCIENFRIKRNE